MILVLCVYTAESTFFPQVASLKEVVESLTAEREKVSSSMKDIIHGAEGYKVCEHVAQTSLNFLVIVSKDVDANNCFEVKTAERTGWTFQINNAFAIFQDRCWVSI